MSFSEQEMTDIGFIRSLLGRAPTLNSAEALRRLHMHAGRYPTTRVQHWLHASVGDNQRPHDDVLWRRCWRPDRQSRQAGENAVGNSPRDLESPCSQNNGMASGDGAKGREKKLQSQLRNTPWHRPSGMPAEAKRVQ